MRRVVKKTLDVSTESSVPYFFKPYAAFGLVELDVYILDAQKAEMGRLVALHDGWSIRGLNSRRYQQPLPPRFVLCAVGALLCSLLLVNRLYIYLEIEWREAEEGLSLPTAVYNCNINKNNYSVLIKLSDERCCRCRRRYVV